jgi:microcystin-dependent protein
MAVKRYSGTAWVTQAGATPTVVLPAGMLSPYAGSTAPTGWLLCAGQEVAISAFPSLSTVLGTTYGALTNGSGGVGTTHFRVPDLRGRTVAGEDDMGGTAANRLTTAGSGVNGLSLGAVGGAENVTLTALQSGVRAHNHGISDPGHIHYQSGIGLAANGSRAGLVNPDGIGFTATGSQTTGISISNATAVAAQDAHNNVQPTMVMNYIIKT